MTEISTSISLPADVHAYIARLVTTFRQIESTWLIGSRANYTGTIFHKTRTPLLKWYWPLYRMATDKVGVSVAEMQRVLEIGDYKTAWLMAHKIRKAMADRDARYRLAGLVEMDDAFFGPRGTRHGRGSERKRRAITPNRLQELPTFLGPHTTAEPVQESRNGFSRGILHHPQMGKARPVHPDLVAEEGDRARRAYSRAAQDKTLAHCRVVLRDPRAAGKLLPWVHRVISNVKAVIRGAHRGVSEKHLQAYLSEIAYRFNRRYWGRELFDRLVKACVSTGTITYRQLTAVDRQRVS